MNIQILKPKLAKARAGLLHAMTLLETIIVLIIATAAIAAGGMFYAEYLNNVTNKATADQLKDVSDAFAKYIQDNYAPIIAALPASKIAAISFTSLQPDYLDSKFVNQNPWQQSYVLTVRQPDPLKNILEAIVYTKGGEVIPANNASSIAQMVGSGGGYTQAGGDPNAVIANFDGFTLNLTSYNAAPGGTGKLVSAIFMNETGVIISDYLYRNAITGRPELNRMNTALDMNSKNVDNVGNLTSPTGNIQAQTGTVQGHTIISDTTIQAAGDITSTGGQIHGVTMVSDTTIQAGTNITAGGTVSSSALSVAGAATVGSLAATTTVAAGSTVSGASLVSSGGITAASDVTTSGGDIRATTGKVQGTSVKSDTMITMQVGAGSEGSGCTTGTISLDGSGRLLSCVGGAWRGGTYGGIVYGPFRQIVDVGTTNDYLGPESSYVMCAVGRASGQGLCDVYQSGGGWWQFTHSEHEWMAECQAVCLQK